MKREIEKTSCNNKDNKDFVNNSHNGEKKIRLFGIEFDTSQNYKKENKGKKLECDESVNSSPSSTMSLGLLGGEKIHKDTSSTVAEVKVPPPENNKKRNKLQCQYCFKKFGNSQALGGHQNAHKKERLRKKRFQLQERRESMNYYLQPYKNSPTLDYHISSSPWSFDQFPLYEEAHISFNKSGKDKWYVALQPKDCEMFTLTQSKNAKLKQTCKHLDLQLGLSSSSSSVSQCNHFSN